MLLCFQYEIDMSHHQQLSPEMENNVDDDGNVVVVIVDILSRVIFRMCI